MTFLFRKHLLFASSANLITPTTLSQTLLTKHMLISTSYHRLFLFVIEVVTAFWTL